MSKRPLPRIIQKPVTVVGYPPSAELMSPQLPGIYTTGKRVREEYMDTPLVRINNPNKRQRNIQIEGPIYWDDGYKLAVKATNTDGIRDFEDYVRLLEKILPCDICREHFKEAKRTNRLSDYKYVKDDSGKYIGCFVWWFILQNTVRERQGKPLWQFDGTYFMYYDEESKPCKNCGI